MRLFLQQYQDAIKAHKAGRSVNLSDLPVPPGKWMLECFAMAVVLHLQFCARTCTLLGCPPLQGSEGSQQNFMGVLETALKLANQDADAEDEEAGGQRGAAAKVETL